MRLGDEKVHPIGLATSVTLDHEANAVSIRLENRGGVIGCPIDINQDVQTSFGSLAKAQQILYLVGDGRGLVISAHTDSKRLVAPPWNNPSGIGSRWKTAELASNDKR